MAGSLRDMTPAQFSELLKFATPAERPALLRERFSFAEHLDEFCWFLWEERFSLPFNDLHWSLFRKQSAPGWRERKSAGLNIRTAIAAPRSYAKSTIATFARLVHDIVYDREAYIVVGSATEKQSLGLARDLKLQFTAKGTPLDRLYGPFKVTGGVEQFEVSVRGRPSVAFMSCSSGGEVRGTKSTRGLRPTKFVLDDGEKKDRVRNPEQRHIWWQWLTKDVLKLGDRAGGFIVEVVGTILHGESGLARLLKDAGWESERWQAIIKWPVHAELWERCRHIWADLSLGDHRRAAALAFFHANRAAMEYGSQILDPGSRSLFDLYEMIWSEGLAAFLQEMQNDPSDPNSQIFFSEKFTRFRVEAGEIVCASGRRVRLSDLRIFGRWDPSTGSVHGDFAAIAILGRDRYGYTYVLDVWMRRAKVSDQLSAAWTLAERWGATTISLESNGFQGLLADSYPKELEDRRASGKFWRMNLVPEPSTDDKDMRIATLEPDVSNGWLQFNESLDRDVLGQFDSFPTGDHDDGPDAVHAAWRMLGGRPTEMSR
ncbi:MAG: phage terminase large subunit [Novosphingobium sp.]